MFQASKNHGQTTDRTGWEQRALCRRDLQLTLTTVVSVSWHFGVLKMIEKIILVTLLCHGPILALLNS